MGIETNTGSRYCCSLCFTYIILRLSTRLVNVIGETGNNVMMRLMGLILMVIAVECFVGGMKPILIDIIQNSHL